MAKTVTARIDDETEKALHRLALKLQKTESQLIRDGIHILAKEHMDNGKKPKKKFYGLGAFDSGLGDLATNKKYMRDFGK